MHVSYIALVVLFTIGLFIDNLTPLLCYKEVKNILACHDFIISDVNNSIGLLHKLFDADCST